MPPGVLYFNNFDDGKISGWNLDPGWGTVDGALCGKGHQWANYVQGSWRDYRFAFRLRLDQGQLHANYRVVPAPPAFARYFITFDPKFVMLSKQVGEAVNRAIERLPEDLRTAIVLRELEGLSYEEIAETMNCPIGTVRSRIFRAREAIAEELRPLLDTSKDKRW